MQRGWARHERDEKRMVAAGLKSRQIYREDRPSEQWGQWKMRPGEELGVVDGFRALGTGRHEIMTLVREVHDWGAVVVDAETGKRSDKNGAEMLDCALAAIHNEARRGSQVAATEAAAAKAKKMARKLLPKREALVPWRNPDLTTGDALRKMRGWSFSRAYRRLGKRDVPTGRRSKT